MLFRLPRELRDQVYAEVIQTSQAGGECYAGEIAIPDAPASRSPPTFSFYSPHQALVNLKLASKQTCSEVRQAVAESKRRDERRGKLEDGAPSHGSDYRAVLRISQHGAGNGDWTASFSWTEVPLVAVPQLRMTLVVKLDGESACVRQEADCHTHSPDCASTSCGMKLHLVEHVLQLLHTRGPDLMACRARNRPFYFHDLQLGIMYTPLWAEPSHDPSSKVVLCTTSDVRGRASDAIWMRARLNLHLARSFWLKTFAERPSYDWYGEGCAAPSKLRKYTIIPGHARVYREVGRRARWWSDLVTSGAAFSIMLSYVFLISRYAVIR